MQKCVIKPQYESYWQGDSHNFILYTPGLREVMGHEIFIKIRSLVDNKIYKMGSMLHTVLSFLSNTGLGRSDR